MGVGDQRQTHVASLSGKRQGTHFIGGRVGPTYSSGSVWSFRLHRDSILGPSYT